MSNLIIDETYTTTEFADNFFELFENHNKNLISNFIQQVLDGGGTNFDVVMLGNLINERFYAEWLFQSAQEQIKRKHNPRFEKQGQIDG